MLPEKRIRREIHLTRSRLSTSPVLIKGVHDVLFTVERDVPTLQQTVPTKPSTYRDR